MNALPGERAHIATTPSGRFAPSPSGPLHFGSLVAAVASYADARSRSGTWRLRIDDIDVQRSRPEAVDDIVATLAHHGFRHDGAIARQSQRIGRYDAALAALQARGAVFACRCSRADLAAAAVGRTGERIYPGTCRTRGMESPAPRGRVAWRVAVDDTTITFVDRLQGPQQQMLATEAGDFVAKRSDGHYAYQLAIVVDDGDDAITDVVRGADLLHSTARQILLQRLLGLPTPTYLHVPVAINPRGDKLSKQTRARALAGDPVAALAAAWQFLGQVGPVSPLRSPAEFWQHAVRAWTPSRIAPVEKQPCPTQWL